MTTRKTMQNALPIVCAAYARKLNVKIQIGGNSAYTDGKTIVLPHIPDSWGNFDAVWGYLAHEAAHVRFTDWSVDFGRGALKTLLNIFEDCRIEREMIALYPGMAYTLNEVARYMSAAGHYGIPNEDTHPAVILESYCLYFVQHRLVRQDAIQREFVETEKVFKAVFPKAVYVRLQALLRRAPAMASTEDAMELAKAVLAMLEEEAQKDDDDSGESQDQNQDQSQSGDQDGDDQGNSQGQSQSGDQDGDDQGDSQDQSQSGDQDGDDQGNSQGQSQSGDQDGDDQGDSQGQASHSRKAGGQDDGKSKRDAIAQALAASDDDHIQDAHEALREEMESNAEPGQPRCTSIPEPSESGSMAMSLANTLQSRVRLTSAQIRSQLMGLVQSSKRTNHRPARSGVRVNGNRLTRLKQGDSRVFKRRSEQRKPNTAVHLLVDMSSSMGFDTRSGVSPYQVANEAALALALGLEAIPGVNPAVTYFGGNASRPVISAIKHGQSVSKNVDRFTCSPHGTTPMAEAIWYAGFELTQTREEKKLLVVVTDGAPNCHYATNEVIALCESSGFEMIGIGIESDAIKSHIPRSTIINDVTDLQSTLFELIGECLVEPTAA